VQLYVQHENSLIERPRLELKGFRRIHLAAGQKTTVQFDIPSHALAYWNTEHHAWEVEEDSVKVYVGSSSANLPLNAEFSTAD